MPISNKQWERLWKKYGDLVYSVSYKITGDSAITSFEDNVSDLSIAIIEAVEGFEKQNNGENGKLEDFIDSVGFDKYLKTVLWHKKASKGIKTKKKVKTTSIDKIKSFDSSLDNIGYDIESNFLVEESIEDDNYFGELSEKFKSDAKEILLLLSTNDEIVFTSGEINKKEINRITGWNYSKINDVLLLIGNTIKRTL